MAGSIDVAFLQERAVGSSQAGDVARSIAARIGDARRSVHFAVYHFDLKDPVLKAPIVTALRAAAGKGVDVRIAYYDESTNASKDVRSFGAVSDPTGTAGFLHSIAEGTSIGLKAVEGSHLLHDKFMVVDGGTPEAKVLTGSTNFTDGAWKFMENNIVVVEDEEVGRVFESVFGQLWDTGRILRTGGGTKDPVRVGTALVSAHLSPGQGKAMESTIAGIVRAGRRRVHVAAMVLSSEIILQALVEASRKAGVEFGGIFDEPETVSALRYSRTSAPELFAEIRPKLVGKKSRPYDPGKPDADYDYMHDKIVVSDDTVVTGSFNFSKNATENAENILVIEGGEWADAFVRHIDAMVDRYRGG